MINLLPSSEKINLGKEKQIKIVLILAMGFLYFLICFLLILFSIKFYIKGEIALEKNALECSQGRYEYAKMENIENDIKKVNKDINLINNFYENKNVSAVFLKNISEIIPDKVCLTNITYYPYVEPKKAKIKDEKEKEQKYSFQVLLSGTADTREDLFNFKQIIEKQDEFMDFYIPPSNWAKPLDVNFNLKFKVK